MKVLKVQNEVKDNGYETFEVNQSEKKRLESLKERKQAFKAKEQAVKNALKNLDNKSRTNKIIFDDDIDEVEPCKETKKRHKDLFDNDESEDEDVSGFDNIDFKIKNNVPYKPTGGKLTMGNDERFKLDKRFMEDDNSNPDNEVEVTENNELADLEKEKEWQLNILGNVLGVPLPPKNKDIKSEKKGMIRYDPTENDHKEYEITVTKSEVSPKKVKKKRKVEAETVETAPVEVSKDIYFSVSDSLAKSLKEEGQFSLLKTYGVEESTEKNDIRDDVNNEKCKKDQKFRFSFDTKNPFKYDSSDNENETQETVGEKSMLDNKVQDRQHAENLFKNSDRFFFDANDPRFNEARKFFSKDSALFGDFKSIRQELKQIVRGKIRQNINKSQPWSYKKKVKKSS